MAVLGVRLDDRARSSLSTTLLCLHLSGAVIAIAVVIVGLTLVGLFHRQRDLLQDAGFLKLSAFVLVVGLCACAVSLVGAFDCGPAEARWRFANTLVRLLPASALLLVVLSICTAASIYRLTKGYEKGFLKQMEAYDADADTRLQVDRLQVEHRCCGSKGYKDWLETDWHPASFGQRGVPFTCCDPEHMGPCPHATGKGAALHSTGCARKVSRPARRLLQRLSFWLLLPALLQLVAALGTQYLRTSLLDDQGLGDLYSDWAPYFWLLGY